MRDENNKLNEIKKNLEEVYMGMHNQIWVFFSLPNKISEFFILYESCIFLGDTSLALNSGNRDSF